MNLAFKPDSLQLRPLLIMILYIFIEFEVSLGLDTIIPGRRLYSNETLISSGGKFELGFFSPGNSTNSYVGIWYKFIPLRTIVWVANRDSPVQNDSRLELTAGGNLILFDGLNNIVWLVNNTVGLTSVPNKGVLLEDGNFVLSDGLSIIWQSFDYPTDTWLPRGKIGIDESLINQRQQLLTSWKNTNDPASGKYSFGMDPRGSLELVMWMNQTQILYRSQVWNGNDFDFFPNLITNFSYIINGKAKYFTYNASTPATRYVMTYNGQIDQLVWSGLNEWVKVFSQPRDSRNIFAVCGANGIFNISSSPACNCYDGFQPRSKEKWQSADWSAGCIRTKPLDCSNTDFNLIYGTSMPANSQSLDLVSYQVCKLACLGNCTCTAYAYNGDKCSFWTSDLMDTLALGDSQSVLFVKSSDVLLARDKKNTSVQVALFITVPLFICISLTYLLWRIWRRKYKKQESGETNENLLFLNLEYSSKQNTDSDNISGSTLGGDQKVVNLPQFSFSSISAATDNFSPANKLGEGGFGPVYKGNLFDGHFVAVKRLSTRSGQGLEELRNETVLIAKLQHRNLVRLLGCCIEQDESTCPTKAWISLFSILARNIY